MSRLTGRREKNVKRQYREKNVYAFFFSFVHTTIGTFIVLRREKVNWVNFFCGIYLQNNLTFPTANKKVEKDTRTLVRCKCM